METTGMRTIQCDAPECRSTCELASTDTDLEAKLAKRGWFTLGSVSGDEDAKAVKVFHFCPLHRTMTLDDVAELTKKGD